MAITSAEKLMHGIELFGKERQYYREVVHEKGGKAGVLDSSFHPRKVILGDYGENSAADQPGDHQTQDRSSQFINPAQKQQTEEFTKQRSYYERYYHNYDEDDSEASNVSLAGAIEPGG
jgi:hypothetical protein